MPREDTNGHSTQPFRLHRITREQRGINGRLNCETVVSRWSLIRNFSSIQQMLQMEQQIDAIFREMIKDVLDSANVSDAISITINHNSFTEPMFIY